MLIQVLGLAVVGLAINQVPAPIDVCHVQATFAQPSAVSSPVFPSSVLIAEYDPFNMLDDLAEKQSVEDAKLAAQARANILLIFSCSRS